MQRYVCVLTIRDIVCSLGSDGFTHWPCHSQDMYMEVSRLYSEIKHTVVKLWQATDSYHAKCHRSQISAILGSRDVHVFDLV